MAHNSAAPQAYMTVGELAKKTGTTVRALQHYHKMGVLAPSAQSAGGRRLYTDRDLIQLHQVLSLKYLGFSLEEIKGRLPALDTPAAVAAALAGQEAALRGRIASLSQSLQAIEALRQEVLQMQTVDFKKYADIVVNVQLENKMYKAIKHMDEDTLDQLRRRFDQASAPAFLAAFQQLCHEAAQCGRQGADPAGALGQALAKVFWQLLMQATGGDPHLFARLQELGTQAVGPGDEWQDANRFLEPALGAYFDGLGCDPREGVL